MKLSILYEDNHLLAVAKPAGLPTMGVAEPRASLLAEAKRYVKEKYRKPGNVYLGIVSRLDAPVTGVILMARTSKAAARLSSQFREGSVEKKYWALIPERPDPLEGECHDWIRHDERHRRMHIAARTNPLAKEARLRYRTLKLLGDFALLEVELLTGRSTKSACNSPNGVGRSWVIASTVVCGPLQRESPCMPASWRASILSAEHGLSCKPTCRTTGRRCRASSCFLLRKHAAPASAWIAARRDSRVPASPRDVPSSGLR